MTSIFQHARAAIPGLVAVSALSLSGCETLDNDVLAAIGAGAGCAAVSLLTGGDERQTAAAAAVCAIVGFGVTREMEARRESFASDEQFYDAELARLEDYERQLSGEVAAARDAFAADRARAVALREAARNSELERDRLRRVSEDLVERRSVLDTELETAEENLEYQEGLIARMKNTEGEVPLRSRELLTRLETSVDELRSLVDEHEQQTASLGAYL